MLQIKQRNAGSRHEWLVEKRYTFGTGEKNNYKVSGIGVEKLQAGLDVNFDSITLVNIAGGDCVTINGEIVEKYDQLQAGDVFTVGDAEYGIYDPKKQREEQAKQAEKASWYLKASNTALANKKFALVGSQVIGRSSECDIQLNIVHLSRKHARITPKLNGVEIEDLNSANGTYINGTEIDHAFAREGDEIRFDTMAFSLIASGADLEKTRQHGERAEKATSRDSVSHEEGSARRVNGKSPARGKFKTGEYPVVEQEVTPSASDSEVTGSEDIEYGFAPEKPDAIGLRSSDQSGSYVGWALMALVGFISAVALVIYFVS